MPPFAALAHHRAPRAARKPTRRVVHGVTLHDDYAWLRAKNWQQVIEEPEKVPSDIARYLGQKTAMRRRLPPDEGAAEAADRRDARPHGGR